MLKNITRREYTYEREYYLAFDDSEGNGFAFPCDAHGNLLPMEDAAMRNYKDCMAHPEKWERWNKVEFYTRKHVTPAHGTCTCGREVALIDEYCGACQCECGRWYNLFGQELVAPEHWEDDPSESDAWEGYEPSDYSDYYDY